MTLCSTLDSEEAAEKTRPDAEIQCKVFRPSGAHDGDLARKVDYANSFVPCLMDPFVSVN